MVAKHEQTACLDLGHLHECPVDATAKAMGCRMFHDGAGVPDPQFRNMQIATAKYQGTELFRPLAFAKLKAT